jgi:hypothetical protein
MRQFLLLLGLVLLAGCQSFDNALHSLNERHLSGCYEVILLGGAGYGGGVTGQARGVVVTGEMPIALCLEQLRPGGM